MNDVVLKAIKTARRRLKVGDPVATTDDLAPYTFDDLKSRGFIGSSAPQASASHSPHKNLARAVAMKGDD